jgi:hypothetical protein
MPGCARAATHSSRRQAGLTMVCITIQAFPTSSGPALVPPFGCQSRTLPSAFLYRRTRRLSQGTANPFRATPMVRPLCLAEPGRGDASCTTRTLAVFFHPPYRPAGQPSGIRAFRFGPIRRPVPSFQRFRPFGRRALWPALPDLSAASTVCQILSRRAAGTRYPATPRTQRPPTWHVLRFRLPANARWRSSLRTISLGSASHWL